MVRQHFVCGDGHALDNQQAHLLHGKIHPALSDFKNHEPAKRGDTECFGIAGEVGCARTDCEWVETGDPSDGVITTETPTTTNTTMEKTGCCAGDSSKSSPMCNAREGRERCEKSSSGHFVGGEPRRARPRYRHVP